MNLDLNGALGERILFFDGAMGTQLQRLGLAPGERPERWNAEHPDRIVGIHSAYLQAGADIVTANTFGANALRLGADTDALVRAGVGLAREAVRQAGRGWVALDMGPTGRLLQPMGDLDFEDAAALFAQVARAGAAAGADCVLIETMTDLYELKAAVLGAREANLPIFATVALDAGGKLLNGADIETVATLLEGLGVQAMGVNCGLGPEQMEGMMARLRAATHLPLLVQPNAGLPIDDGGAVRYDIDEERFAQAMRRICQGGAWLAGGCCGTTPEHIARLKALCAQVAPTRLPPPLGARVCSGSRTVALGPRPILVGERINPTGKARLKQALRAGDMAYVMEEAVKQAEAGADVLDVNVGLPDIDEPAVMVAAMQAVQSVTDLPLQIDTASPAAMEAALRRYNGKPMVNSVSGKREVLDAVLPLVKKYGGVVVGLTLDEDGIPEDAQGRLDIARRILDAAQAHGVPRRDVVIDALTLTISTGADNARVTLEALRRIKGELGALTTLGVSNISFGLPGREHVNAAFLAMALDSGLDAAILNPCSAAIQLAFRAGRALRGQDDNCQDYIALAAQTAKTAAAPAAPAARAQRQEAEGAPDDSLAQAVRKGLKEAARARTQAALDRGAPPLELISVQLMPALDAVGAGFEKGALFLPQLLMSAEAAKAAFAVIQERMAAQGGAPEKKGRVLLATVKGDVHDIGKNIVRVLLDNYGFAVTDLGKDVAAEEILRAVRRENIRLVGLSALMTTTVRAMEETIALLHHEAPGCRVMVGGAVLNPEYAQRIGADFYGKDAMASVAYAQSLLEEGAL